MWAHALVVQGFCREFRLVASRGCKGMHESEFGRRVVMDYLRRGVKPFGRNEISWWDFLLFWPLWDLFMRSPVSFCRTFLLDLLKLFIAFLLWDVLMKFIALCCIFSDEISWWDYIFFWPSLSFHSILVRVLPFAFFFCALTVNIIDLLFL